MPHDSVSGDTARRSVFFFFSYLVISDSKIPALFGMLCNQGGCPFCRVLVNPYLDLLLTMSSCCSRGWGNRICVLTRLCVPSWGSSFCASHRWVTSYFRLC